VVKARECVGMENDEVGCIFHSANFSSAKGFCYEQTSTLVVLRYETAIIILIAPISSCIY